ncbi:MAG: tail fiber domain-containing protein [Chitinophagaceae bacterium]|nr:tail fiber domain-containing protein [Chitinophagaceae bacterium]
MNTVMQLRPVTYNWKDPKDGTGQQIGFIAQEVETLVPEAVVHSQVTPQQIEQAIAVGKPVPAITDPYGIKYSELIPVLTKAIQEQQLKIEQLEKELFFLKSKK